MKQAATEKNNEADKCTRRTKQRVRREAAGTSRSHTALPEDLSSSNHVRRFIAACSPSSWDSLTPLASVGPYTHVHTHIHNFKNIIKVSL